MISVGSEVQILLGPPLFRKKVRPLAREHWGLSSDGRAVALQASGHRFDPDRLHQFFFVRLGALAFSFDAEAS